MELPYPVKKGFTLIELLVVISIMAIISGITIPTFSNYTKNQTLVQAQEIFKSELRSVQNKALVGTGSDMYVGTEQIKAWGVAFGTSTGYTNTYDVFMTTSLTSCDAAYRLSNQTYTLPTNAVFDDLSRCIIFRMDDGNVTTISVNGSYTVSLYRQGTTTSPKTIILTHPGLIRSGT